MMLLKTLAQTNIICWSVICGDVDNDLRLYDIGPLVHSRWLTLACKILRLFSATKSPSKNLITLAQFCLKVYFPTWFMRGSKNLYLFQRIVSFPNQKVVEIALEVLQNNGFFPHPENILLGDDDEDLRRTAVNKLCSLRLKEPSYPIENDNHEERFIEPRLVSTECTAVQKFFIPKINLRAKSFHKMNLNLLDKHEPPATKQLSYEEK